MPLFEYYENMIMEYLWKEVSNYVPLPIVMEKTYCFSDLSDT